MISMQSLKSTKDSKARLEPNIKKTRKLSCFKKSFSFNFGGDIFGPILQK